MNMKVATLFCVTLSMAFSAQAQLVFPKLKASNLSKQELTLPRDFSGEWNLVLIAFQREQQREVDTWLAALPKVKLEKPSLAYYELPTIKRPNSMTRWFIDSGMRRGIPDQQQRDRTITLYIDKEPFEKALAITSENQIYALLLNKSGAVVWRAEGTYDETKGASLREFLRQN
jgi:hypothetical protein